ncbi:heavy metal sensor histidine kinase [Caballeronia sp. Lep1P3]|uniref:heavy metal sensor histidine kinase n=1 Tax=Caballeronia sp. Lep1P3 TaxID=2878150 RepID=UPI00025B9DAA|nr:heavy metal sensor histidine kinase [Caballeronia sp. Lep1P3]EKS72767.1 two-component regulatory system, sensor kinase protein [Burkholderia sp. SJ98]
MKRFFPRTLRARLTVLIVVSTSTVLALSGLALYEALRSRIESTASEQMTSIMVALQGHFDAAKLADDIARNPEMWSDQLHDHPNMAMAIYDRNGRRLLGTPGFQPYGPARSDPAPPAGLSIARPGSKLRYLAASASLNASPEESVRVVLQYDGKNDAALLRAYAYTIVVIEVLGVMLASALAYGIAKFGLKPLRQLVARAEQMSTARLAHPLPSLDTSGELKELELAFNGMVERLNESFTRLSEFSSNLAHDMRTPLTNLQAAAQVALSQERSADQYKDVIESSIDEFQRLSRMIEDMLFIARSERADALLKIRRLDAAQEAERVAGFYESLAEEAGVTIRVSGQARVDADLLLFQRALSNLISNSIAHAPRGSVINVKCEERADRVTVSVSDAGGGIESPHVDRIFDRFYRVDPSRHSQSSSSGLGLAIVRSIMDSHDGSCGVESRPNEETKFWLTFPRRAIEPAHRSF